MLNGMDRHDLTQQRVQAEGFWDGGREGVYAFGFACLLSIVFFASVEILWLPQFWKIFLTLLSGTLLGYLVARRVGSAHIRHKAELAQAYRDDQAAITKRKIDQMNRAASNIPKVMK